MSGGDLMDVLVAEAQVGRTTPMHDAGWDSAMHGCLH